MAKESRRLSGGVPDRDSDTRRASTGSWRLIPSHLDRRLADISGFMQDPGHKNGTPNPAKGQVSSGQPDLETSAGMAPMM